jgi:hypothetical protein
VDVGRKRSVQTPAMQEFSTGAELLPQR